MWECVCWLCLSEGKKGPFMAVYKHRTSHRNPDSQLWTNCPARSPPSPLTWGRKYKLYHFAFLPLFDLLTFFLPPSSLAVSNPSSCRTPPPSQGYIILMTLQQGLQMVHLTLPKPLLWVQLACLINTRHVITRSTVISTLVMSCWVSVSTLCEFVSEGHTDHKKIP